MHKLVMVGAGGVGKSALTLMYMFGDFVEEYDPTKADSYRKDTEADGERCQVDILDTAGQEEYAAIRDTYYRSGEGFLLVFDLTRRASFEAAAGFWEQIVRVLETQQVPLVLVGNKSDLAARRAVSAREAEDAARTWGCRYVETSARDKQCVDEAFQLAVRVVTEDKAKRAAERAGRRKRRIKCCVV